jgi:hypothetical protein
MRSKYYTILKDEVLLTVSCPIFPSTCFCILIAKNESGSFRPDYLFARVDSPWVVSPRKVSRFAPLNRYYIIKDEVFFDYFWEIIYLLVVHTKKIIIHSFWSIFVKDLK